jgi:hypothetical protein
MNELDRLAGRGSGQEALLYLNGHNAKLLGYLVCNADIYETEIYGHNKRHVGVR